MTTKLAGVNTLKRGTYVIFDNVACIVKDVQSSKTGKHGHAKYRIEAVSITGGKKIIKVMPASDNVTIPIIEKETAQVLSVQDDTVTVMNLKTYETFDLTIPEEFKDQIKEGVQVIYWVVMDDKSIKQVK